MSWVVTAVVAVGAVTARMQYVAGKQQEIMYKEQAEQEKFAAQGQELERRQRLNKVLAANIMGASTSGIAGEGSPLSLSLESAKMATVSEGIEAVSAKLKEAQLRRQGANAAAMGRISAASTLLSTGIAATSIAPGGKTTTTPTTTSGG